MHTDRLLSGIVRMAVVASACLLQSQALKAQGLTWVEPAISTAPSGRCCAAMAFDWKQQATLLFGGFTPNVMYGDTWIWRNGWTQLSPATAPSPRQGPWMVWDGAAQNIVLFGGTDSAGNFLNDTWIWDGIDWIEQFPLMSPPGRRFDTQGMTYDAEARRVMLFGGLSAMYYLGDTWTWDGVEKSWTRQFPAVSPTPRRTMLAYDYLNKNVVLFGGDTAARDLGDTWTWDGLTWTKQFPASSPSARGLSSIAWDDRLGAVVLFGGNSGPGENLDDTWVWTGANWIAGTPRNIPPGRFAAPMDYDAVSRGLVLFAGI